MKHRSHRRALPHGMEVSARSYLADLCVSAASTDGRRQSRSAVSGALLVPWTRTSTGQRSFATYLKPSDHQNCRSLHSSASSRPTQIAIPHWPTREPIYLPHGAHSRQPPVAHKRNAHPALDSAGCSCGCRVPSSGAVVTVQRVRRQLQISRLDATQHWPTSSTLHDTAMIIVFKNKVSPRRRRNGMPRPFRPR